MKNRTLSLVLALLACAGVSMTACGKTPDSEKSSGTDGSSPTETETAEVTESGPTLELPESDYGGKKFTILAPTHAEYEYVAEKETGDIVSDAIYKRNRSVEELLNVTFDFIIQPGHWADKDSFNASIKNSVMANDGEYDLVSGVTVCVLPTAAEGIFMDVADLKYVNLDNPWWVQGIREDLSINDKLFGFIGDASLSLYKDLTVMYFNKQILTNYGMENPYDLVRNGKWTFDVFMNMAKEVSEDIDGNGRISYPEDRIGYSFAMVPQRAFQTALEYHVIDFDKNGTPSFAPLAERESTIYNTMLEFITDKEHVYGVDPTGSHPAFVEHFAAGQSLFMTEFLYATDYLRTMKDDFGLIPLPKYDEAQKFYHTQIGTSTSMYFVPTTVPDPDLTSKVCEAMSFFSWRDVSPIYYEVALKEKYTRDEDVKEMLNIIRSTAQMDFLFAYSTIFTGTFPNQILPCDPNIAVQTPASFYKKHEAEWNKCLEKMLDSYAGIDS